MSSLRQGQEYLYQVIKRPLVTEKSSTLTSLGKYTFEVLKMQQK